MKQNEKWTFYYKISAPSQDPYLMVDFYNENMLLLFDCGIRVWGQIKTIMKIRHLFISHAHIDHMIGFDHIIRSLLGENKRVSIYGPSGIIQRISSKLEGYDWDRAEDQELVLEVHELGGHQRLIQTFECKHQFKLNKKAVITPWTDAVVQEKNFCVKAIETDHGGSPCLAYYMEEIDHMRIDKDRMTALGLEPDRWVGQLLRNIQENTSPQGEITVNGKPYPIQWLRDQIVHLQRGRKIAYITDTIFSQNLLDRLKTSMHGCDIIVCESTFMDEDLHLAVKYHHLTASQAATIAKETGAQRLILFHISNRYFPRISRVLQEARKIFPNTELANGPDRPKRSNSRSRSGSGLPATPH